MSVSRTKDTYLAARYRRIAARRGPVKAIVAIERAILIAVWNLATHDVDYAEPGGDFYTRRNPDKAKSRAINQLRAMGYAVILSPLEVAAS